MYRLIMMIVGMALASAGLSQNVGVGTQSPDQKLHINGNMHLEDAFYDSGNSPGNSGDVLLSSGTGVN